LVTTLAATIYQPKKIRRLPDFSVVRVSIMPGFLCGYGEANN
jgi:hypothetical protein